MQTPLLTAPLGQLVLAAPGRLPAQDLKTAHTLRTATASAKARLLRVVCTALLLVPVFGSKAGVVVTGLHSFAVATNGLGPNGGLIQGSDGSFYGTTSGGGTNGGYGTVFKISPSGALTTLHSFKGGNEGSEPTGLIQAGDGSLYGTTYNGGTNGGRGAVFKIGTSGTFTSLYSFSGGDDGGSPGGLIRAGDGYLYGTTTGFYTNHGTVFRISTNGALTTLYSFTGGSDGADPSPGLVQASDGNFYGTTTYGGLYVNQYGYSEGTVFRISSNGLFTSLYSFSNTGDGEEPNGLVLGSDGNIYGSTWGDGADYGTVFQITTDGTLTTLYNFSGGNDGMRPSALARGNDGAFYGTTLEGGSQNGGTAFRVDTNGVLTTLCSFPYINSVLEWPSSLVQGSDGSLYGTTAQGGSQQLGSVFQIDITGTLTNLFSFTRATDGANPQGGLVQAKDARFYGTTSRGGAKDLGTVFAIDASGSCSTLYSFDRTGGANPAAGLTLSTDGGLYGTAAFGGFYDSGSVFRITTNGAFARLHSFTGLNDGESPSTALIQGRDGFLYGTTPNNYDNVFRVTTGGALTVLTNFRNYNQNANPQALVQGSDGNFYGTLADCFPGSQPPLYEQVFYGYGTVFKMSPAGAVTTLHAFDGVDDGANPLAGLVQGSDGNLYGTTSGGTNNAGTVFQITTNGVFTNLYFFTGGADGAIPMASLVQGSDGNFYGTTFAGGSNTNQYGGTYGTVFRISTNGVFTTLYSFTGGDDGANPQASLVQGSDGSFYGTTASGGAAGGGSVFRLTIGQPTPAFQALTLTNGLLSLSWSSDAGLSYQLQSSSDLGSTNWTNLGGPLTAAGTALTATDSVTNGPRQFYRVVLLP